MPRGARTVSTIGRSHEDKPLDDRDRPDDVCAVRATASWMVPGMIRGGMKVGADHRLHTMFGHNPSTLRLCSFNPNLFNIPRGGGRYTMVKDCIVAPPGALLWNRDYSAIEAVLVGYFAGSPHYIRFAKLGVHAYLASHLLQRPADLSWSDEQIRRYFKELKSTFPDLYNTAKRVVHLSNYMGTPQKMYEIAPEVFQTRKRAAELQGVYFELFPEIRVWHKTICLSVDGTKRSGTTGPWELGVCTVRNPFGYLHRFYNVLDWEKIEDEWHWSYGEDAKRLCADLPQSTASGILKRAIKRLWYEFPDVGSTMRLPIYDSIMGEAQEEEVEQCLAVSQQVMEAPINALPLDPTWNMGEYLTIGTEGSVGKSWASLQ